MPGQVKLIKLVIICKVQKSLGLVFDIKNVFCLKWKRAIRPLARKTTVPQGKRNTERKIVSSGRKGWV